MRLNSNASKYVGNIKELAAIRANMPSQWTQPNPIVLVFTRYMQLLSALGIKEAGTSYKSASGLRVITSISQMDIVKYHNRVMAMRTVDKYNPSVQLQIASYNAFISLLNKLDINEASLIEDRASLFVAHMKRANAIRIAEGRT